MDKFKKLKREIYSRLLIIEHFKDYYKNDSIAINLVKAKEEEIELLINKIEEIEYGEENYD